MENPVDCTREQFAAFRATIANVAGPVGSVNHRLPIAWRFDPSVTLSSTSAPFARIARNVTGLFGLAA